MSAHADADEIMRWLRGFKAAPKRTFIVHGEPTAQDALGARISAELGWEYRAPEHGERVEI
jgi:metallo-beta-lactamase family protein